MGLGPAAVDTLLLLEGVGLEVRAGAARILGSSGCCFSRRCGRSRWLGSCYRGRWRSRRGSGRRRAGLKGFHGGRRGGRRRRRGSSRSWLAGRGGLCRRASGLVVRLGPATVGALFWLKGVGLEVRARAATFAGGAALHRAGRRCCRSNGLRGCGGRSGGGRRSCSGSLRSGSGGSSGGRRRSRCSGRCRRRCCCSCRNVSMVGLGPAAVGALLRLEGVGLEVRAGAAIVLHHGLPCRLCRRRFGRSGGCRGCCWCRRCCHRFGCGSYRRLGRWRRRCNFRGILVRRSRPAAVGALLGLEVMCLEFTTGAVTALNERRGRLRGRRC